MAQGKLKTKTNAKPPQKKNKPGKVPKDDRYFVIWSAGISSNVVTSLSFGNINENVTNGIRGKSFSRPSSFKIFLMQI